MKPYVYIAHPIPEHVESYIAEHCDYNIWNDSNEKIPKERLKEELKNADGAMLTGQPVDEELLAATENLKAVSTVSVGYDRYDIDALKKYNVYGTHTPYVLDDTVADLIFGLILSGGRRIAELHEYVKAGEWGVEPDSAFYGYDIHHSTLGIIGMGRIGEKIVQRARFGFEMDIVYHNRSRKPELEETFDAVRLELNELLSRADFVVVMVPLTDETKQLIGEEELRLMKSSAVLINGARGPVVDENALVAALQEKSIFSASLDVFEQEPLPKDHPLLDLPNVTLTPHIGSATQKTDEEMMMRAAVNMVEGASGQTPQDVIKEQR
ncbi:2-hydroxyacid dehydrogenase [Natribacillus halophilus]|uniref:Glyoxylate/hydroxypyruvate reductase B n=1 Tax=Natribacillus halophilus TaxID=549003 RepID=A0A1G8LLD0_9BACI|nr:D-glycerate dehydrogenase [Natribacillus halophilus]SDI56486.1 gluconate 2-dehydrogenase [Natribacillus halophilus]